MEVLKEKKEILNPYRFFLRKVEEGKINPLDVRIDLLVESFKVEAEVLDNEKLYHYSAMFLQAVSKLLKLKTNKAFEYLFPENGKKKRIAITKREVEEVLKEFDNDTFNSLLDELTLKGINLRYNPYKENGKKGGRGNKKFKEIKTRKFEDFVKQEVPFKAKEILFENTDYNAYALEVAKKVKDGTFKIRNYKDFIGLMFAIYIFNIDVKSIEKFL